MKMKVLKMFLKRDPFYCSFWSYIWAVQRNSFKYAGCRDF